MAVNRSGGILKFLKLINVKQFPANLLAQFMEGKKNPPPKKVLVPLFSIGTKFLPVTFNKVGDTWRGILVCVQHFLIQTI